MDHMNLLIRGVYSKAWITLHQRLRTETFSGDRFVRERQRGCRRILRKCLRDTRCPVDMPAETRTYLVEVTLQSFMKTQTSVLDVLLATETQRIAQLQGNMQKRVV
ncbi:hypothetical protein RB195_004007 [Necator americanus]|uniref:Uncharacterized protein n=1 Tax=Necator americanus TaxID=51031 RepID=A0ABR1DRB4_NECAM